MIKLLLLAHMLLGNVGRLATEFSVCQEPRDAVYQKVACAFSDYHNNPQLLLGNIDRLTTQFPACQEARYALVERCGEKTVYV